MSSSLSLYCSLMMREGVSLRLIAFLSVLLPLITPNSTFEEVVAEITRKREANEANPSFSSTELG